MKKEIFTIYFPSWHPDRHYEQWYGKGFSEWELVKNTKPLFDGHQQPKCPQWGYFDESDPEMMIKQIDLAADSGITGFLFDWYWYNGEQFLEKPLDEYNTTEGLLLLILILFAVAFVWHLLED